MVPLADFEAVLASKGFTFAGGRGVHRLYENATEDVVMIQTAHRMVASCIVEKVLRDIEEIESRRRKD